MRKLSGHAFRPHPQLPRAIATLAIVALAGCGSAEGVTCGELRGQPGRFASAADELAVKELGEELRTSDCNSECRRRFTAQIERRFRKECNGAADDRHPLPDVRSWLHQD